MGRLQAAQSADTPVGEPGGEGQVAPGKTPYEPVESTWPRGVCRLVVGTVVRTPVTTVPANCKYLWRRPFGIYLNNHNLHTVSASLDISTAEVPVTTVRMICLTSAARSWLVSTRGRTVPFETQSTHVPP